MDNNDLDTKIDAALERALSSSKSALEGALNASKAVQAAQAAQPSLPTLPTFMTFTQGIIGMFFTCLVMGGWIISYTSANQADKEALKERCTKLEYQASISIDDRKSLHEKQDSDHLFVNDSLGQLKLQIQSMDSNIKLLLKKNNL